MPTSDPDPGDMRRLHEDGDVRERIGVQRDDVGVIAGNAVHTALTFPLVGEDVLVTGCGPIGLMTIAIARRVGARYVVGTDVSPARLELAKRMGADAVIDVSRDSLSDVQRELGMREGFDVGCEMSGAPSALRQMIDNMNHGGRIAMLGLPSAPFPIDWGKVVTHMLTLKGIYGREMFETWNAMGAMLQTSSTMRGAIGSVISDPIPARDWQRGFEIAASAEVGKVVLDWTDV